MSQALIDAVTDSVQSGNNSDDGMFDLSEEDSGVFDDFEARLENLHWRETNEGILLIGNDRSNPDPLVRVEKNGVELEVEKMADPEAVNWRRATILSRPGSRSQMQFD